MRSRQVLGLSFGVLAIALAVGVSVGMRSCRDRKAVTPVVAKETSASASSASAIPKVSPPAQCSKGSWCKLPVNMYPPDEDGVPDERNFLRAAWCSGRGDIWVGHKRLLHFDGNAFRELDMPFQAEVAAFWGTSPTSVFAVGSAQPGGTALVMHFDGKSWSKLDLPELDREEGLVEVWGTSDENVYAVGGTRVLHYDGKRWNREKTPEFQSYGSMSVLGGSGPNDVYAMAGYSGIRFDGKRWRVLRSSKDSDMLSQLYVEDIWCGAKNDVILVGHHEAEDAVGGLTCNSTASSGATWRPAIKTS